MLEREREDFAKMCELIRGDNVRRRLKWMIIAVAKADLYWDRNHEVSEILHPRRWCKIAVQRHYWRPVAGDRTVPPRIAIVPFSAHPEAHVYAHGLYRTPAQLDNVQATSVLSGFYDALEWVL